MDALQRKQELLDAVKNGDLSLLESLLHESGNVNAIYPNGKTLLIVAIESQNKEVVEFLTKSGINMNQRDFYDRTPLMYAADKGDISIVSFLLESGADVNAKNKQSRTALMYAAYKDALEVAEMLLNAGAEVDARDHKDRSAYDYSVYKKGVRCRDLLAARGAKPTPRKTEKTGFIDAISNTLEMDEFAELKQSGFPGGSFIGYYIFFLLPFAMRFICGPLAWLLLFGTAWYLLITFPSILKVIPLGKEFLQMRSRKSLVADPVNLGTARDVAAHPDVEFVSHLMDLGSRELTSVHLIYPDKQSLKVKESIFFSRVASSLLAAFILVVVAIYCLTDFSGQKLGEWTIDYSVVIYFALPILGWIVYWLEYKLRLQRLRLVQKDRDRIAGEISEMLYADEYKEKELPPHFGLYLRAFMTTDKLHIRGFDLETMLAYSIAPTLPLLALGKPGEHLGSGRIQTTDEHWQEEILRLMDAARLILIIPSHRGGTLWEISTLRERGYFEKTIFIMPPEMDFHGGKYSEDWKKTIIAARGVGVEFPYHLAAGAFFRLSENGEFEDYAPFVSEEFLQEFEPQGGGGNPGSDYTSTNPDGDGEADISDGMDGVDFGGGTDGGLTADGIDGGADGGSYGGDGGGDGGGNGGGNGGGGNGGGSG